MYDLWIGNITLSDLTRTIPYGDTIDLLELTGESIIAILEKSVTDFETSSASTAFLQLSGITIGINMITTAPMLHFKHKFGWYE